MSQTHNRSGASAKKARPTRSGRWSVPLTTGRVVIGVFTREIPFRPTAFINRATVHRATFRPCTPPWRASSAWTLRTP